MIKLSFRSLLPAAFSPGGSEPLGSAPSRVLEQVRAEGPQGTAALARATGLGLPLVERSVLALRQARLLRERSELADRPVELDPDRHVTVGVHLGRRESTVGIGDLTGQVVRRRTMPNPADRRPDLPALGVVVRELLAELPGRRALSVGLIAPWRDVSLDPEQAGVQLNEILGLDIAVADHVPAMAAAEFTHRPHDTPGTTLYVYSRNTVGFAVAVDRGSRPGLRAGAQYSITSEVARFDSLTHLPTGSDVRCDCGETGCLEATVADDAVVARARAAGVAVPAGLGARRPPVSIHDVLAAAAEEEPIAQVLLTERARTLGRAAAAVRDMVRPDRVVLVGQGFTDYADGLETVVAAFWETPSADPVDLSFSRFGAGVQAVSACTMGLGPVYDDPLGLVAAPACAPASESASEPAPV